MCVPAHADGVACTNGSQCHSSFCTDGYCCNVNCLDEACMRCNISGHLGACTPMARHGAPRDNSCDSIDICGALSQCDGYGHCLFNDTSVICGAPACTSIMYRPASRCNGVGECVYDVNEQSCSPHMCGGDGVCATTCDVPEDCSHNAQCVHGKCTYVDPVPVVKSFIHNSGPFIGGTSLVLNLATPGIVNETYVICVIIVLFVAMLAVSSMTLYQSLCVSVTYSTSVCHLCHIGQH